MVDMRIQGKRLLEKLRQKAISVPSEVALAFSTNTFLEKNILYPRYERFLREHKSKLPVTNQTDAKIVEELERTGICVTSLESLGLPNTSAFFHAAKDLSQTLAELASTPAYKDRHTLTATSEHLMKYPEMFCWGLNERLLKIVERYLGLPVAYDALSFYFSNADAREAGPRLWHRDKEDWRMIKIAVYINDVDDDGGPFQCVRPELNSLLCHAVKYKYKNLHHKSVEKLISASGANWLKTCTGQAGTVIFVDTALYYHRGKPPTRTNRSAIFFSYFSRRPRHPFFCGRSPFSREELYRLAQGLSPHQQACVRWKENLSDLAKWIPKNQVKV